MKNKNFLEGITEEYIWDETRGLFISKSMKLISNSVPIVQDRKLIKNAKIIRRFGIAGRRSGNLYNCGDK